MFKYIYFLVLFTVISTLSAKLHLGENFDPIHVVTAFKEDPCVNFRIHETDKIKIVISAQFAADHLDHFKKQYPQATIVDCRQESKFFINGHAITIQGNAHNNINHHLNKQKILQLNDHYIDKALSAKQKTLHRTSKIKVVNDQGYVTDRFTIVLKEIDVEVSTAMSEPTLVEQVGLNYIFLPITDHEFHVGDFNLIHEIVTITLESIERKDQALYFHCQKGIGRSTIAALMALVIVQAKEKSLDEIKLKLKESKLYMPELNKLKKRAKFFSCFHNYCKEVDDFRALSFGDWIALNQIARSDYLD